MHDMLGKKNRGLEKTPNGIKREKLFKYKKVLYCKLPIWNLLRFAKLQLLRHFSSGRIRDFYLA